MYSSQIRWEGSWSHSFTATWQCAAPASKGFYSHKPLKKKKKAAHFTQFRSHTHNTPKSHTQHIIAAISAWGPPEILSPTPPPPPKSSRINTGMPFWILFLTQCSSHMLTSTNKAQLVINNHRFTLLLARRCQSHSQHPISDFHSCLCNPHGAALGGSGQW